MDPYIAIEGPEKLTQKTKAIKAGGMSPTFNEKLIFSIADVKSILSQSFKIAFFAEDAKTREELGFTSLNFQLLYCGGNGL